jgi:hypothetical protein
MAEAAISAPPAPAAPAAPPSPSPSPAPPIHVTPSTVDKGPSSPPPKPGTAKEQMFKDLRKKVGAPESEKSAPTETDHEETDDSTEDAATDSPVTDKSPDATVKPGAADKKKVSPWKLVEEHKAARLKAETEMAEYRKNSMPPEKVRELVDNSRKIEERAKALEEEIRFTNYAKSQEFADKYQKPYEDSWKRWMGELGELTLPDTANGGERAIAPQDLLDLVNLPLGKARDQAENLFGSFANDVMSARKEIRGLFNDQNRALEEARKGGTQRETQRAAQMQESQQKLGKEIGELWTKSNELAQADERFGKFLKPVEGDDEVNGRLKKGFEIADRAFSVNPLDPSLNPEQRQQIVQLHAAVRNRAAAFGRLVYQNEKLESTVKELQAKLDQYKESEPGAGEGQRTPAAVGGSAKEQVFSALRKYAH